MSRNILNTNMMATLFLTFFAITAVMAQDLTVNITILHSAIADGAVCLDGSPPAYYLDRGYGSGLRNWIIYLHPGGWCDSIATCHEHTARILGSSKFMDHQSSFGGILHNSSQDNPEFYNWNRVMVMYCDGASFTGDVDEVDPDNKLFFRGARIFKAVMDDLLRQGMQDAENAILSGLSAGGLSTILNCDKFKCLLPSNVRVKCVADAGFFINGKTVSGTSYIQDMYDRIVTLHGSAKNLPPSCTSIMEPSLCFFPENVVPCIQTPLFIINSAYDSYQINTTLVPGHLDPQHVWDYCKVSIKNCTYSQRIIIQGFGLEFFGLEFLTVFEGLTPSYTRGYYITSCHTHGGIQVTSYWFKAKSPRVVLGKAIAEAVADWFFDRAGFHQYIDSYPFARDCDI